MQPVENSTKSPRRAKGKASAPSGARRARLQVVSSDDGTPADARPIIAIRGGELPRIVDEAEAALIAANIGIYQRGDFAVSVGEYKFPTAGGGESRGFRLAPLSAALMREHMTKAAQFSRFDARCNDWVAIDCPKDVAETYLARQRRSLPAVLGVVHAPVLRPDDWSIIDKPGFDERTGIIFEPLGCRFLPVKEKPTRDDALAALELLRKPISGFPFVDENAEAVALSAILTPFVRLSVPTVPLHAYTAPTPSSGKSKLVSVPVAIAWNRFAHNIPQSSHEEENEKRLMSALLGGSPVLSFDNCDYPLGGGALCQAVTEPALTIRLFKVLAEREVPNTAMMFATGNNLRVLDDMARRVIMCEIDAKIERPELRSFEFDPVDYALKQRPFLVRSALTVLRAYAVAGMPSQGQPTLGGFEAWSRIVRDALLWLGAGDAAATVNRSRASDPYLESLAGLLESWHRAAGDTPLTVAQLVNRSHENEALREALAGIAGERGIVNTRSLGKWLSKARGRPVGGRSIEEAGGRAGVKQWRVRTNTDA